MAAEDIRRGDIYYISGTENYGAEQKGNRPAVIVSNDVGNYHSPVVEAVYLTTKQKNHLPTHVKIHSAEAPSIVLCEQISTIDKSRLEKCLGHVTDDEMKEIDKAIAISLDISREDEKNMEVKIVSGFGENSFNLADDKVSTLLNFAFELANGKAESTQETQHGYEESRYKSSRKGYRGFLLLKCDSCGKIKGFYAKNPITQNRCDCGYNTDLNDLIPVFMDCKCGKTYKYLTNITDDIIEHNCMECGSPVDMRLNKRRTAYVTMGEKD